MLVVRWHRRFSYVAAVAKPKGISYVLTEGMNKYFTGCANMNVMRDSGFTHVLFSQQNLRGSFA